MLRERILKKTVNFVTTQHSFILVLAVLLTLFSLTWSALFLETKTGRIDLVSEKNPACKRFLNFLDNFGSPDNLVILVEGETAVVREKAVEKLAVRLREEKNWVEEVFYRVPVEFFEKKGLQYADEEMLRNILESVSSRKKTKKLSEEETKGKKKWPTYWTSKSGNLYFLFVKPTQTKNDFKFIKVFLKRIETQLDAVKKEMPGIEFGLTGVPPIIYEEMVTTTSDVTRASIVSFLGILLLFIFSFRAFRKPMMVATVMFMGISYTFLFATLAVGSLNLMSIVFASMILGSGNDFGVHILMRYREERLRGRTPREAVETVISQTGQGILSGAAATAAVFYTLVFSDFKGFSEFGLISGTGVLICAVSMLIVVPAFLVAWEKSGKGTLYYDRKIKLAAEQLKMPHVAQILRWPKTVIAACLGLTLYFLFWIPEVGFNGSLLDIQAKNSKSYLIEQKMMKDSLLSPRFAAVLANNLEEAKQKEEQLKKLPAVAKVESVLSVLPKMTDEKRELLNKLSEEVIEIERMEKSIPKSRLEEWKQFKKMVREPPVTLEELPESLRDRFVGKDGKLLLYVFPKKSVWGDAELFGFTEQIMRVDPEATGTPFLIREVTQLMEKGYLRAGALAFLAVVILLWLDFRRILPTLFALVPLVMGVLWMLGVMGMMGLQFNPANLIALPLIFGISIDNGVHLVHRFFEKGAHRIEEMMKSTVKAVYLNAITTIVCFGALMLANHRGIASLGFVLVIGVTTCLTTAVTFLPALLKLLAQRSQQS